jgi:Na+/phosphate symporter
MNLGEALSLLKKEKSRLARLISLRKENVFVEEGKKTEFDPKKLSEDIEKKIEDIRKLKIRIQKTNISSKLERDNLTIAEAIIKIGDIRSKLSNLSSLFERKRDRWYFDKDTKNYIPQLDESETEEEIEKLEAEKTALDNKIQISNWNTELLDY